MKYSTLKKTAALSIASLMVAGLAEAQTVTTTTTDTTVKMSSEMTTPKVFGGLGQYKSFSIGINGGLTSQTLASGGSNDFSHKLISYGYGLSLREQLSHTWGLQLDLRGGEVKGDDGVVDNGNYTTKFWQPSLSLVANIATISWLHRKDNVSFFATGGGGLAIYHPDGVDAFGNSLDYLNPDGTKHYVKEFVVPVGVGVKFRLADAVALNLGYTENFIDGDNFDGLHKGYPTKDRYSYGYAGLEFTLGSKSKPNIDWVNPVALMYDELYDAALRQEVEALKGRVTNVENAVNDLKKDSDGDGVSDQFDKCPNTPAGTVVDGAGCEIKFPKADSAATMAPMTAGYSNIQFEFDSSVLRTSSYPVLDATSADMRANTGKVVELDGFASSEGTAAHNMRLSKDRANSVKTYLVNSGVDAKRLKVKAYGETHPVADNSTEAGRIANRRVEFKQR